MGLISDQWRARAKELEEQLPILLGKPRVSPDVVAAVHASVVREVLTALADMLDVKEYSAMPDNLVTKVQEFQQRNQAVRLLSAKGDWDGLSKLLDATIADAGGSTAPAGGTATSVPGSGTG